MRVAPRPPRLQASRPWSSDRVIRLAGFRLQHLEQLYLIESEVFGVDCYQRECFEKLCLDNQNLLLVARQKDRVVGYAMGEWKRDGAEVVSLAVDAAFQGRGIGKALLQALLARFVQAGAQKAFLMVRTDNDNAISLYSRLGFRRIRKVDCYYMDGQAAYRMRLQLPVYGS